MLAAGLFGLILGGEFGFLTCGGKMSACVMGQLYRSCPG
ncbi:hypothetical protein Poly59_25220 [Rubripirellula reticaptiva]|uniref:Uncharacterized protein n=1 Tax=Rubripirellula reticaptiva TaxID=2528013 RepID=A0A5C6F4D8_9BACT|nr:hypothetical protein Poly59_25220 [Rubripirellula reticaptiva]